ncbi:FlaD/FlaE family flagellar protein, partial [Methanocalculus sp.]|uniref:FlaD/FlaE family flagellar protein n=1 Tax=Methanocalculus sp. TaxID=2004547 RepID=UPI00271C57E8
MAVNQSQVDSILAGASAEDPEVKLQNLEREVELLKKSIKKLLIDIRERLNEGDNPLTVLGQKGEVIAAGLTAEDAARLEELELKVAELFDMQEANSEEDEKLKELLKQQSEIKKVPDKPADFTLPQLPPGDPSIHPQTKKPQAKALKDEKLCLQKVYHLFNWTKAAITKYGHDRLDIMLDSYRSIGYITKDAADEVKEIARIMPASLGEEHEVGADEFVSELYILNRIMDPDDTSLDRDMIAVMMERDTKKGFSKRNLP